MYISLAQTIVPFLPNVVLVRSVTMREFALNVKEIRIRVEEGTVKHKELATLVTIYTPACNDISHSSIGFHNDQRGNLSLDIRFSETGLTRNEVIPFIESNSCSSDSGRGSWSYWRVWD